MKAEVSLEPPKGGGKVSRRMETILGIAMIVAFVAISSFAVVVCIDIVRGW